MTETDREDQTTTTRQGLSPAVALFAAPFALFSGATYYPAPGWQGHIGQYATIDEATEEGKRRAADSYGWWQVVDLRILEIVAGEGSGHTGLWGKCEANPAANVPALAQSGGEKTKPKDQTHEKN